MGDSLDFKKVFTNILMITMITSLLLTTFFIYLYRNGTLNETRKNSMVELESQKRQILNHFRAIQSDLLFLPKLNELISFKELHKERDLKLLENELLEFTRSKHVYDQVRYIDAEGQEIIRINNNGGTPTVVPTNQLQNKLDRYYFTESIKLREGEIYVSPFDLNIEHGEIEQPIKPTIRFSTPIFNLDGSSGGIIIFNYLGQTIMDDLKYASDSFVTNYSLLNTDGYWLYSSDESKTWGFHYPERKNMNLRTMNPKFWIDVIDGQSCHILDGNTLYCVTWIKPFEEQNIYQYEKWLLINAIDLTDINLTVGRILFKLRYIIIIIILLSIIVSMVITSVIIQKRKLKLKLQHSALYDPLTDLPNRRLLNERLDHIIEQSTRYNFQFALIFIDLDGFKSVNDTYGHDAGDQLLKQCAARLRSVTRSSDTVSRIGGDEFVIILSQVNYAKDCEYVAQKILQELTKKFELEYDEVFIGGSLGIVINDGTDREVTRDDLLSRADAAMYRVKESGKNNYLIDRS